MSSRLAPLRTPQLQQRLLGRFAAVHASGPEEDNGVLDVAAFGSTGWLEILRQDAKGTGVGRLELRDSRKRAAAGWTCRKNCIIFARRRCRPSTASPAVRRRWKPACPAASLSEGGTTEMRAHMRRVIAAASIMLISGVAATAIARVPVVQNAAVGRAGRCRRQEESAADRRKASRDRESRVQGQV